MDRELLRAAEKGNAESQFNRGVMYENGSDNNHYSSKATDWRPEVVAGRSRAGIAPRRNSTSRRCMPADWIRPVPVPRGRIA